MKNMLGIFSVIRVTFVAASDVTQNSRKATRQAWKKEPAKKTIAGENCSVVNRLSPMMSRGAEKMALSLLNRKLRNN